MEVFDDAGQIASAMIESIDAKEIMLRVESMMQGLVKQRSLIVAAAVPKGDRADWMVEKLSELGVDRFIPLAAQRSVVLPAGKNKIERWTRLAVESAKQSRRVGVMQIAELTAMSDAIASVTGAGWYLSTRADASPIHQAMEQAEKPPTLTLFIGPEGGWTDEEIAEFDKAKLIGVGLTKTILRIETAAIAAAAVIMCNG